MAPSLTPEPYPAFLVRYGGNRTKLLARDYEHPTIKSVPGLRTRLVTKAAVRKYASLSSRTFIDMGTLPLGRPATRLVQNILEIAGLLSNVVEEGSYVGEIVKEFYANIGDIEFRDCRRHCVYIRGTMFEITPWILNDLFQIPNPPYDMHNHVVHTRDSLENIVFLLSDGTVQTWEDLTPAHLNPIMALLYTICCQNWIPTANEDTLQQEQARPVYMVVTN